MKSSETIEKIASALSKCQAKIQGAIKNSTNPHFKSSYADLASIWDSIRIPLSESGLSIVQTLGDDHTADREMVLTTTLLHDSGQWIASECRLLVGIKKDMQALGSAITYARRYAIASMLGVPQLDDDGNMASNIDDKKSSQILPLKSKVDKSKIDRTKAMLNAFAKFKISEKDIESITKVPLTEITPTIMDELSKAYEKLSVGEETRESLMNKE